MIKYLLLHSTLFALLLLLACQPAPEKQYGQKPEADAEKKVLHQIIRYCSHLPKKANEETKFEAAYDTFYMEQVEKHRIDLMYRDEKKGDTYLLASRIAPSMTLKRVGIGIKLRLEGDSLVYYEEVFRTWKMPEETLAEKGSMLFHKMVAGKDLSPYYPQHSGKEEYIEFPDPKTRFSVEKRRWVSKLEFTEGQPSRPQ